MASICSCGGKMNDSICEDQPQRTCKSCGKRIWMNKVVHDEFRKRQIIITTVCVD